jgi:uncharacterized protein
MRNATLTPATAPSASTAIAGARRISLVVYLMFGTLFGIVLTKAEVLSWFRVQEMFRFQAFHMYGTIAAAVLTAMIGLQLIKQLGLKSATGEPIAPPPKVMGRGTRYWLGGSMFGVGWALVGACPGPLLALIGGGASVLIVTLLSAMVGTLAYGHLRTRLPH